MNNVDHIIKRLNELNLFIDKAQEKLHKGEIINLSHLDQEVGALCEQTLRLKPVDAVKAQPIMAEMISKLENLSISLKEFQDGLKAKI